MKKLILVGAVIILVIVGWSLLSNSNSKLTSSSNPSVKQPGEVVMEWPYNIKENCVALNPNTQTLSIVDAVVERYECPQEKWGKYYRFLFDEGGKYTLNTGHGLKISFDLPKQFGVWENISSETKTMDGIIWTPTTVEMKPFSRKDGSTIAFYGFPMRVDRINNPEWKTEEDFFNGMKGYPNNPEDLYERNIKSIGDRQGIFMLIENHWAKSPNNFLSNVTRPKIASAAGERFIFFFESPGWYWSISNVVDGVR